jgi:phage/plasmid-associated DNA primase
MQLSGYLQRAKVDHCGRISHNLIRDILVNLKADTLAGLPEQKYKMPCWLPDGTSAENWMCFKNQIVNIRDLINSPSGILQLSPLTPKYFGKFSVDYDFDLNATCPGWMEYLNTTFDDPQIREMLQMMFGYILSGSTRLNVGFFLIGKGGDGKSVAGHILRKLVG